MKIYAHRGYSALYPENTMLAFKKAVEFHADGIETDVHKTKDNILVLCHDEAIDRTSNGTGFIHDMTYEELAAYDYKFNKTVDEFIPIPKLEELLQLAKDTGILLNIEIKTDNYQYENIEQMTYDMVKAYGLLDHTMFSSFHLESLITLRKIDSSIKVGYLFEPSADLTNQEVFEKKLEEALSHGIYQIHPKYVFLDDATLKSLRKKKIEVNAWTINAKKDMAFFKKNHLDGCITNYVERAIGVVKK